MVILFNKTLYKESHFNSSELMVNINESAFDSITGKLDVFIQLCSMTNSRYFAENLAWVLNAPMGHGKTTALTTLMKILGSNREQIGVIPLLLVFPNTEAMSKVVSEVIEYGKKNYIPALVTEVHEDNVTAIMDRINQFQFVCITQQRFRDLALQTEYWRVYSEHTPFYGKRGNISRHIICDEMPIFFNYCVFDVGSTNNCVEWFDELAYLSHLNQDEKDFARNSIAQLLASEIKRGINGGTHCLEQQMLTSEAEKLLNVLYKLNDKQATPEYIRKLRWFIRLLTEENVGHIDGNSLICSEWIDYKKMGNILILDGTSSVTSILYENGGYEIVNVPNFHNYSKRLFINHMDINTSSRSRNKADKGVQTAIRDSLQLIRSRGINPLPLCSKSDIEEYIKNGAITDNQKVHFVEHDGVLSLNLLNVTGRNELSSYDSLAFLNLPVRPPQYYRIMAVGLYGVDIDTRTSKEAGEKNGRWFFDQRVEDLFIQSVLSDMSQIIHRTNLRNLNSDREINIYMYHNQAYWNTRLQELFKLSTKNIRRIPIKNKVLHHFDTKAQKWAERAKQICIEIDDGSNSIQPITPAVIGNNFKKWLSEHWVNESKRGIIEIAFRENGLSIEENPNNKRKLISLVNESKTEILF
jgi:hypothetical protein